MAEGRRERRKDLAGAGVFILKMPHRNNANGGGGAGGGARHR